MQEYILADFAGVHTHSPSRASRLANTLLLHLTHGVNSNLLSQSPHTDTHARFHADNYPWRAALSLNTLTHVLHPPSICHP